MKISIIGAGNVGGLTAMRLAEQGFGEIILVDIINGLAKAKALDLEDANALFKYKCRLEGTQDFKKIKDSNILIITAGLTRKAGMAREELLKKNAQILKDISRQIKELSPQSIVIVVTNPVDILTYLVIKETGFAANKVFGIGANLDAARFTNLISKELGISTSDIDALVVGCHGETMLPLSRLSYIKGVALKEFIDEEKINELTQKTIQRGLEILSLLGSGSASFAPSAAIYEAVKAIVKDEKRTLALSCYLKGEYGIKDLCIGVPCRLGRDGIEEIIELELNNKEKEALFKSVSCLKELKRIVNGSI